MFIKRTDLALENHEIKARRGVDDGIILRDKEIFGFKVTEASVKEQSGEKKYITLELGRGWRYEKELSKNAARAIAGEINGLIAAERGSFLAVGLGNESITPDSLGPKAIKKLIVTRHIEKSDPALFVGAGFSSVAAICPGVLGQTGIESAEIVKSVCERIKPDAVIIIDALAARSMERLGTTLQITDAGITPGSGVANARFELSEATLGVKTVALGVPTVVDAATLAFDLLEGAFGEEKEDFGEIIAKICGKGAKETYLSPKESDALTDDLGRLIGISLNAALHGMEVSEAEGYFS